jgi:hypothetical protein
MMKFLLLTTLLAVSSGQKECPIGWIKYLNTNCYNVFTTLLSFDEAISFCSSRTNNSYLASINSDAELKYVQTFVNSTGFRIPIWV